MAIPGKQLRNDTVTATQIATSAPSQGVGGGNAEGSSQNMSRADHDHALRETGGPTDLTLGAIPDGAVVQRAGSSINGTASVSDAQHGSRASGSLHADSTGSVSGFMSAADFNKLASLVDAAGLEVKPLVRAATVAAGTLATDFENGDTLDSIVLVTGDRILIKDQASAIENGIHTVNASGAPTRAADQPTAGNHSGDRVFVDQGGQAERGFFVTTDKPNDVTGTDTMDWQLFFRPVPISRQERITTQIINNSDVALTDTLNFVPISDESVLLLFNGVAAIEGAGEDYTISGQTITWLASSGTAPNMQANDDLVAYYMS